MMYSVGPRSKRCPVITLSCCVDKNIHSCPQCWIKNKESVTFNAAVLDTIDTLQTWCPEYNCLSFVITINMPTLKLSLRQITKNIKMEHKPAL